MVRRLVPVPYDDVRTRWHPKSSRPVEVDRVDRVEKLRENIPIRRGGGTGFSPLLARNPDKIESDYSQMEAIQKQRLSCAFVVSNLGYYRVAVAGGGLPRARRERSGRGTCLSNHSFIHSFDRRNLKYRSYMYHPPNTANGTSTPSIVKSIQKGTSIVKSIQKAVFTKRLPK